MIWTPKEGERKRKEYERHHVCTDSEIRGRICAPAHAFVQIDNPHDDRNTCDRFLSCIFALDTQFIETSVPVDESLKPGIRD